MLTPVRLLCVLFLCRSKPTNETRPMDWVPESIVSKQFVTRKINDSFVKEIVFGMGPGPEGMGAPKRGTERPTKKEIERDSAKLVALMSYQLQKDEADRRLRAAEVAAGFCGGW